jgi:hypothetical protein
METLVRAVDTRLQHPGRGLGRLVRRESLSQVAAEAGALAHGHGEGRLKKHGGAHCSSSITSQYHK